MFYYNRIDVSEGIYPDKSNNSKECIVYNCLYFNHTFKSQNSVCNGCHDLTMSCLNPSDISVITVTSID